MSEVNHTCRKCKEDFPVEVFHQPEQNGGPETEYIQEYWEVETDECPACGTLLNETDERRITDALRYGS